ncbi:cobalamin biosynthesis protein [Haloarculaceae archaeon H-GB2-1]|nr:cobalamin biosynthesis protein [Haloarculaceae archaeon H-GB1-1]MEA5386154.1 cobalamin biosynthesis protein [Haloarculaceae archaeon H-GB11]MEA5407660.1 cobalamin biosynthesis protein [Haloarculaceae archaeon H-GB2-1]
MSTELETPSDMLESHPETAYFWGRVVGDGELTDGTVTVRANDETAARRLAAIAGAEQVDHRIVERDYAHDTSITRSEDEFEVTVDGPLADRAAASLGLPIDGDAGGYRLDVLEEHPKQLLRGLLEGCGTICFKSDDGTVGMSFVHDDEAALDVVRKLLDEIPPAAPYDDLSETSSGGYWFGVDDEYVPDVGEYLYDGVEETGLFDPERKRKLTRSLDQAENV